MSLKSSFDHIKTLWSFYTLMLAIIGASTTAVLKYDSILHQININRITSKQNTMLLLEQEIFALEKKFPLSNIECNYYDGRAFELELLQKELGNKYNWKRKDCK